MNVKRNLELLSFDVFMYFFREGILLNIFSELFATILPVAIDTFLTSGRIDLVEGLLVFGVHTCW